MGIHKNLSELIIKACQEIGVNLDGCCMCELGAQFLCGFDSEAPKTAKEFYEKLGVKHTSIDIMGKYGSLVIDLCKPIAKFINYFDIVTNYGTGEHVEDQYNLFKNIHNLVRIGGAIVNVAPPIGEWKKHVCLYYYEPWFFKFLAEKIGYRIIYDEVRCGTGSGSPLICSISIKNRSDFLSKKEFNLIGGIVPKQM